VAVVVALVLTPAMLVWKMVVPVVAVGPQLELFLLQADQTTRLLLAVLVTQVTLVITLEMQAAQAVLVHLVT
jgi:hypothetical protein